MLLLISRLYIEIDYYIYRILLLNRLLLNLSYPKYFPFWHQVTATLLSSVIIQDFRQSLLCVTFEILNKDHKKHPIPKTHNLRAPSFVLSPKRSSALHLLSEIVMRSPRPGNRDLLHCRRLPRSGPPQQISHADFVSKARRPAPVT